MPQSYTNNISNNKRLLILLVIKLVLTTFLITDLVFQIAVNPAQTKNDWNRSKIGCKVVIK